MSRRWSTSLFATALAAGSLLVIVAGQADAAVAATPAQAGTTHVRPGGAVSNFVPGGLMKRPTGAAAQGQKVKNDASSTNWSGYAVTGSAGAYNSVSSSWTEPSANCTGSDAEYAAFWVGLDGYNSGSVEQTGTDSDCDGTTPDYYGWYEMYPAAPVYFSNPVAPGDSMSASVTFSGTETYTLVLTDNTQGWNQTITANESGLSRSSAEVITEAPSSESGVLPLADFGTVSYGGASANGSAMSNQNPTGIIMVDSSGNQQDTTSSIDGSGDFSNGWLSNT
jgi:Peptidase A4 family